ncbi:MAG: hydroxymethylbilane synthase, partial [Rhodospirillaceae bacterium]
LDPDVMLPACAQGAIGITCRASDDRVRGWLAVISHAETVTRITAERALLAALDGSCRTPIGGLAEVAADGGLRLRGLVARADGSEVFRGERAGAAGDAETLGRDLGDELRRRAGDDLFR